jgi:D-glycero-alpha-D-manno-heptose-7-phosphate kinase
MIISRTPFRVSFAGGGTDLRAFYSEGKGSVTSTAIDKYMYVTINKRFDGTIRLSYTKTEIVDRVDEIRHELVKEALKKTSISGGVEITTMADIPAGTGLGSSSSLTVGLLNAFYAYQGKSVSAEQLAKEACEIEIDIVKEPIGKQDQYIAAYGGLQHIQFQADESVFVDPVICSPETKKRLEQNLMMFFTGITRSANSILTEQQKKTADKRSFLEKMQTLSEDIRDSLTGNDLSRFGSLLHEGWMLKKQLVGTISTPEIDAYYEKALSSGALGGKLMGAGGGGFILLYCEKDKQGKVREALKTLKETTFSFEPQGSKILYVH